jgi:UDP-N-acetylglucosamine transferase subunit ALG13
MEFLRGSTLKFFCTVGNARLSFRRFFEFLPREIFASNNTVVIQAGFDFEFVGALFKDRQNCYIYERTSMSVFEEHLSSSDGIFCHGGVGVISSALKFGKYPAVLPRRYIFKEHVNDHQLEYCEYNNEKKCFYLCSEKSDFKLFFENELYKKSPALKRLHEVQAIAKDISNYLGLPK